MERKIEERGKQREKKRERENGDTYKSTADRG